MTWRCCQIIICQTRNLTLRGRRSNSTCRTGLTHRLAPRCLRTRALLPKTSLMTCPDKMQLMAPSDRDQMTTNSRQEMGMGRLKQPTMEIPTKSQNLKELHVLSAEKENWSAMERNRVVRLVRDWIIIAHTMRFAERVGQREVMSRRWKNDWVCNSHKGNTSIESNSSN